MKLQNNLLATALLLATGVRSGCYSGGEKWNKEVTPRAIELACNHFIERPFKGEESKQIEVKVPNQCYFFQVELSADDSRKIKKGECVNRLTHEYTGCPHGGDRKYTIWRYKADPNRDCKTNNPIQYNE